MDRNPPPQTAEAGRGGLDRDTLMMGVGCVLMLFAGIAIAGILALRMARSSDTTPPAEPSQVALVGAAATAASPATTPAFPSPTPRPTNTPFSTPWPTWTPLPESGSSGSMRPADYRGHDAEYKADVQQVSDFLLASAVEVNDLLKNPQVKDSMWIYKMDNQIGVWSGFFQYFQASRPPARYEKVHANLVKALARYDGAASDIAYAIDYGDPSGLDTARTKIDQASGLLNDAIAGFKVSAVIEGADRPSAAPSL
jgi:hypothetical protein